MSRTMNRVDTEEELRLAFRVFDKDSNGNIPRDELKNVFEFIEDELNAEDIKDIIERIDSQADGGINYEGNHFSCFKYFLS